MGRTQWPAAAHIQQAANEMAWLAPYRDHEGGYRPWRAATRTAHGLLDLPGPDECPICHPPRRT